MSAAGIIGRSVRLIHERDAATRAIIKLDDAIGTVVAVVGTEYVRLLVLWPDGQLWSCGPSDLLVVAEPGPERL